MSKNPYPVDSPSWREWERQAGREVLSWDKLKGMTKKQRQEELERIANEP